MTRININHRFIVYIFTPQLEQSLGYTTVIPMISLSFFAKRRHFPFACEHSSDANSGANSDETFCRKLHKETWVPRRIRCANETQLCIFGCNSFRSLDNTSDLNRIGNQLCFSTGVTSHHSFSSIMGKSKNGKTKFIV